jgi:endonuclease/exonuclease/phosphatase family metal-dependent hydrolase
MWSLNVASYNIMLPVSEPIRLNGQKKRLKLIPKNLKKMNDSVKNGIDIICFQELIPPKYRKELLADIGVKGWKYHTKALNTSYSSGKIKLASGGVVICSKYPIIKEYQSVFDTECTSSDCMASKGIVYARILLPDNNIVNVFSSHFQAWDLPDTRIIRSQQMKQCKDFIDSLHLQDDEPVLFMGDLNIDFYSKQNEVKQLLQMLQIELFNLNENSHPFSSDPKTNSLMGNDETLMYATELYPKGCYDDYMKTLSCPCCPRELLDYIAFSTDHLKPKQTNMYVYKMKNDTGISMQLNMTTKRTIFDLSDHYPLIGEITFRKKSNFKNRVVLMNEKSEKKIGFLFGILFLILIVFIIVFIFSSK